MKWYGSVENRIMESAKAPNPEKKMGVTESMWSDRHAWYIKDIVKCNSKGEAVELLLVKAKTKCRDFYAGDWEVYPYEEADFKRTCTIKRTRATKTGQRFWTSNGRIDGTKYILGKADEYYDPSF